MAASKLEAGEQRSLFLEALNYLNKAAKNEKGFEEVILSNSVLYKATDLELNHIDYVFGEIKTFSDDKETQILKEMRPLECLSMLRYIKKSEIPGQPLMVARTTKSIMMRLPYFKPITEFKNWRNIHKMALFCKEIEANESVTLLDTEYEGTKEKQDAGFVAEVKGLAPNKSYKLACGGYTSDLICVNGIGEQTDEIVPLIPLNLKILSGFLAQISYKLGHYQIAKKAAEHLLTYYLIKNEVRYPQLDVETSQMFHFRLNYTLINC